MGYYIYAWLEQGDPRLRVVDAQTGSICLRWDYHNSDRLKLSDKKEIQRLFRDLLLLTCKQENQNIRFFHIREIQDRSDDRVGTTKDPFDLVH
ncbi:MAG: hypothetical protein L0Y39_02675 [Methylococcaceae bacterium]|nr:hypothetical protein [Methylococcaceae bacterium]